jgi:hypothetical protein
MASKQLFRDTVKAMALGEGAKARELNEQIPEADGEAYAIFVAAMFAGAVGHRFADDQSQQAIKQFVDEMRHDYRHATPRFKPLVMEGVLRVLFGEEHLLDDISPEDQLRSQFMAIRKIVDQSEHMKQRLDEYLTDAEILAAHWQNEE